MPEPDYRSGHDTSCPNCPHGKPVVIVERFGVKRFFCAECEHVWEETPAQESRAQKLPRGRLA
jgi:hypothetical protein